MTRLVLACLLFVCCAAAQSKKVLYVTHSAGFRHDSIQVSIPVLRALSSALEVTATEDLSLISAASLRNYDAVVFFTSGELALSGDQKSALLDFIRNGGGFGGVHSATDTLYSWPEYGELIGGYFDGHPWVQSVRIDVEDPEHPAVTHLAPSFSVVEEIYQFREFRRDRVRVLLSLDPTSVDLNAPGVHRDTEDFPLAWARTFGEGRVFYCALGHFDDTWRDRRFQRLMEGALLWLTRQVDGLAAPRRTAVPAIAAAGNAATGNPRDTLAPGALISIYGSDLSSGGAVAASYATRALGTAVRINGTPLPLLYVSPGQINAMVPAGDYGKAAQLQVAVPGGSSVSRPVSIASATPGVFAVVPESGVATVWATGLGQGAVSVWARVAGVPATVTFAGVAPGFPGLNQINVAIPGGTPAGSQLIEIGLGGAEPFYTGRIDLPSSTK